MPIASPCIGVCTVDAEQTCEGCHRTIDEIRRWSSAGESEKRAILAAVASRADRGKLSVDVISSHLHSLCKPPGSLGELERLALEICRIQNTLTPRTRPRRAVIFAADHGVAAQGVSAWPSEVTAKVVSVMAARRSASGVLAQASDTDFRVVDVGCLHRPNVVQHSSSDAPSCFVSSPVADGTADLSIGPAMTRLQFNAAWRAGITQAEEAASDGMQVVAAGEMGIGNTTSAACLASLLCGISTPHAVGRGAGIDDQGLARKQAVVADATDRARPLAEREDWKGVACEVGGFELVAMAAFYVRAAERGLTIVLDGYIATAAALLADKLVSGTAKSMIASHRSSEPGHQKSLDALGLTPFLDWNLRLGEATGALLLMPMLDAATAMVTGMAKIEDVAT
ncbi:MAG: nicotinate-nucleotide--dimethylbenzimidazole phosphoribosyltransferase [Planctomycetaceae bacterium]